MAKLNINGQVEEIIIPHAMNTQSEDKVFDLHYDPHPGDLCPHCRNGYLDYDGLLNLVCQQCGYVLAGCST